jgi:hypothetical protein
LLALNGEINTARELMEICGKLVKHFYPAIKVTMARRHELLIEAINEAPKLNAQQFDNYLTEKHGMQVGPQWSFYGRGFLLSDIQFWSAD